MKHKPLASWIGSLGIAFLVFAAITYVRTRDISTLLFVGAGASLLLLSNLLFYKTTAKPMREQHKSHLMLNWILLSIITVGAIAYGVVLAFILFILSSADVKL